jgi:CMP-N,N'-diacetyllegionaminic acid synthase
VQHSVMHALHCQDVGHVYVSTDCPRIAAVTREVGGEVVVRPEELAGDTATSESALTHALEEHLRLGRALPERVIFLQATSPLRRAHDLCDAMATMTREGADSLLSVTPAHEFLWSQGGQEAGGARPLNYDPAHRPRRQEMNGQFRENGSFYIFSAAGYLRHRCRIFGRVALHSMPQELSYQIDTPHDWDLAEYMAHRTGIGQWTRLAA